MVSPGFPADLFTIKGNPGQLDSVSTSFGNAATTAGEVASSLGKVSFGSSSGPEAAAALSWIKAFQPPMTSAQSSYSTAAKAVKGFHDSLKAAQDKMTAERPLAEAAWDAKVQASDSYNALNHLPEKNDPDPAVRQSWKESRAEASSTLTAASGEWDKHVKIANDLHSEVTTAASSASSSLNGIGAPPAVPNFLNATLGMPSAGGVPLQIPTLPVDWEKITQYVDPVADPVYNATQSLPYGTTSELVGATGLADSWLMKQMMNAGLAGKGFQQIGAGVPYTEAFLAKYGAPAADAMPYQFGRAEQVMKGVDLASKTFSVLGIAAGGAQLYEGIKNGDGYQISDGAITTALSAGCLIPGVDVVAAPLAVAWGGLQLAVGLLWPGHTASEAIVKGAEWVGDKVSKGAEWVGDKISKGWHAIFG